MFLIIKKNNLFITKINLDIYDLQDSLFGTNSIKELVFFKYLKNTNENYLLTLFEQLKFLNNDNENFYTFIIEYNENMNFSFNAQIKQVSHQVRSYMERKEIKIQERITIRFLEDNLLSLKETENGNFLLCDKKCPYYKETFCNKYNKKLISYKNDYFISKECFLENINNEKNKIINNFYQKILEEELNSLQKMEYMYDESNFKE